MKKYISILGILFSIIYTVSAQNDTITVNIPIQKWDELNMERKQFMDSLSMQCARIADCQLRIEKDSMQIDSLKLELDSMINVIKAFQRRELKFVADSSRWSSDSIRLYQLFQAKEDEFKAELRKAALKSARADTISIQMMMTYLDLKCNENRVITLRENFKNIPNDMLKSDYKIVDDILSVYSETRQKLIDLAKDELNAKKIASAASELYRDIYVGDYRKAVDGLNYVKNYYKNEEYTSSYLNKMLDITYEALESKKMNLLEEVVKM